MSRYDSEYTSPFQQQDDESVATVPLWQPAPSILVRLAGKPYCELRRLRCTQTIAVIEQILALQTWLADHKMPLCDALHDMIGAYEGPTRSRLVALRRNLFNERLPARADVLLLGQIGATSFRRRVVQFAWKLRQLRCLLQRGRVVFAAELTVKRRLLQQSFADPEFQKAVQIASPSLAAAVQRYLQADVAALRMRDRKTEAGAFHYLMRMTAKTSPFGRFGPVAYGTFDPASTQTLAVTGESTGCRTIANINLGIVAMIADSISVAPSIQAQLPVRVNSSYYVTGTTIAFTRPKMVADQAIYTQVNTLRYGTYSPAMRAIVEYIESQPIPPCMDTVIEQVAMNAGGTPAARRGVEALLDKLIQSGLIVRTIPLPSNTTDRLRALYDALAALDALEATEAAARVSAMLQLIGQWSDASITERQAIVEALGQHTNGLLRWYPPRAVAKANRTDFIVEDTGLPELKLRCGPAFFTPFLEDVSLWLECLARRDQGGLNAAWLRDIFTARYGVGGRCDNVLSFAAEYRRELTAMFSARPESSTESGYPRGQAINDHIRCYLETLCHEATADREAQDYALPHDMLQQLTESFPPLPDAPLSVAMHVQFAAESREQIEDGEYLVVLNYTLPGFGHFFSRYCALFDDDRQSPVADQIRARIAQLQEELGEHAHIAELLSVLDHNAQVHPCFTERQIVPPDEVSTLAPDQQLLVKQLELAHDPVSDRLHLWLRNHVNGNVQWVVPIYMGFFHLMALPALHRVFVELSPTGYHMERVKPYEHQESMLTLRPDSGEAAAQVRHYPRLRIGRFVLQREMWAFPPAHLPPHDTEDAFAAFLQTYVWAKRHGLPRDVFVRIKRDPRRRAIDIHTDHKPVHIDLENYFSVKLLLHLLQEEHIQVLHVEEMLPNPDQLFFERNGERYAVEFQLEFNRGEHALG